MTEQEKGAGFGPGYAKSALTYILYISTYVWGGTSIHTVLYTLHYQAPFSWN